MYKRQPPTLTCPGPLTVSCSSDVPPPNISLVTGVSDNCVGTVTVSHISDVISGQTCANRYTLTRTYRATDVCGNTCLLYTSKHCNDTLFSDIIWPNGVCNNSSVRINDCKADLSPDNPLLGRPQVVNHSNDHCSLIAINYSDDVFTTEVDACYKVLRKWVVCLLYTSRCV